jgi:hypothetical protein
MTRQLEISRARVAGESGFRWSEECGRHAEGEKIQARAGQTSVMPLVAESWESVPGDGSGSRHQPGDATGRENNGELSKAKVAGSPIIFGAESPNYKMLIEGNRLSCETNPRGGGRAPEGSDGQGSSCKYEVWWAEHEFVSYETAWDSKHPLGEELPEADLSGGGFCEQRYRTVKALQPFARRCGFLPPALVFPPECTAGQTACPEGKPARVRKIHVRAERMQPKWLQGLKSLCENSQPKAPAAKAALISRCLAARLMVRLRSPQEPRATKIFELSHGL